MERTVLQLDLYPARITVLGTSYGSMRAVVTENELQGWRLGAAGPELMLSWPLIGDVVGKGSIGYDVPTTAGVVRVDRDSGCGCGGSRLASYDLFPGTQTVVTGV